MGPEVSAGAMIFRGALDRQIREGERTFGEESESAGRLAFCGGDFLGDLGGVFEFGENVARVHFGDDVFVHAQGDEAFLLVTLATGFFPGSFSGAGSVFVSF